MRRWLVVPLVLLLVSTVNIPIARADGMILPHALDADYLTVRYHRVQVTIQDGYAVTHVEQEFYNPQSFSVSGRYLFPIPPEAAMTTFDVEIDGQVQTVVRQDAATTNAILFSAVDGRQDPSLLQYVDWETMAVDVTLASGEARKMELEYEQLLTPASGLYHYRYIMSTERYSDQPVEEISIAIDVHSSAGLASLYSSNYPVTVEWLGADRARASWAGQQVNPSEDLDLFFSLAEEGFGGGLLAGRRNGQDHFLLLFSPEVDQPQADLIPKDLVLVLDHSGSMSGEKIEQARNALHYVLGRLGQNDRFSIVTFNEERSIFASTLQPATPDIVANAHRFADDLNADGSTDIEAALQSALSILKSSERRPQATYVILFLTDGLPTAGLTDDGAIADRVTEANPEGLARLHVFGVGYDVNTRLLDRLAADSEGTVTYVQPGENLEAMLTGFYDRIAHPVLTDVKVTFEGMQVEEVYPPFIPDLFQGSTLLLTGLYRATTDVATIRVRGRAGEEQREYVYRFDLSQAGGHDFVPRLWATRKIGALLDRVRVEGETPALVEEISGLGLGYGLVTPYTTFVIAGQDTGAASSANMSLYGQQDLNRVSGATTVQARVQNQAYQQALQGNMAAGANVYNRADLSLAQVNDLSVDLALLQGQAALDEPLTMEWLASNVGIDRNVIFGSAEYFSLAADPAVRPFLETSANVVFRYQDEVIAVQAGSGGHGQAGMGLGAWLRALIWEAMGWK